jgi:hypothetical protein
MKEYDESPTEKIEAHQRRVDEEHLVPDDMSLMDAAEAVVRGKLKLTAQQERMLRELLPFFAPKLSVTATTSLDGKDFASLLERAIQRSKMTAEQIREAHELRLIEGGKEQIETQAVEVEGERR